MASSEALGHRPRSPGKLHFDTRSGLTPEAKRQLLGGSSDSLIIDTPGESGGDASGEGDGFRPVKSKRNKQTHKQPQQFLTIKPVFISNLNDTFRSVNTCIKEIKTHKPKATVTSIKRVGKAAFQLIPVDYDSFINLTGPWSVDAFEGQYIVAKDKPVTSINSKYTVIVIKGVDLTINLDDIKENLTKLDIPFDRVTRITSLKTNRPTHLLKVSVTDHIKAKHLVEQRFKLFHLIRLPLEYAHRATKPTQCTKCLTFGHTIRDCTRRLVCIRCGDGHSLKDCPKPRTEPRCANCGEGNVATYGGCKVYRDHALEEAKSRTTKPQPRVNISQHPNLNNLHDHPQLNANQSHCNIRLATSDLPYSKVVCNQPQHKTRKHRTSISTQHQTNNTPSDTRTANKASTSNAKQTSAHNQLSPQQLIDLVTRVVAIIITNYNTVDPRFIGETIATAMCDICGYEPDSFLIYKALQDTRNEIKGSF